MYSLQKIVYSVLEKVSGYHLTSTNPLDDEFVKDRVNLIRELLIQQNNKKLEDAFYSTTCCIDVVCEGFSCVIDREIVTSNVKLYKIELPDLIRGVGTNDIKYLGTIGFAKRFSRVSLDNFTMNFASRWTGKRPMFTNIGNIAYLKNIPEGLNKACLVALLKDPVSMCDYDEGNSFYPCPQGYKLELLVTQDILAGYNIFPDELNDTRSQLRALRAKEQPIDNEQQQGQQEQQQ